MNVAHAEFGNEDACGHRGHIGYFRDISPRFQVGTNQILQPGRNRTCYGAGDFQMLGFFDKAAVALSGLLAVVLGGPKW